MLTNALGFAEQTNRAMLKRCMAALRVSRLLRLGRRDEALASWSSQSLPTEARECVDLGPQSWREMECICSSRVRLLAALGDFEAARSLGLAFAAATRDRGMVRSLTYANAVSIHVAWCMGDVGVAREHVVENLEVLERTGYCRAMLCHPASTAAALEALGDDVEPALHAARDKLLAMVSTKAEDDLPDLTAREQEVLAGLGRLSDKEIASELGISANGVRYHVKNIFRKLGVRDRRAAAKRVEHRPAGLLRT